LLPPQGAFKDATANLTKHYDTISVVVEPIANGIGIEVTERQPGLVAVSSLVPNDAADACGELIVGDILVEINGKGILGFTAGSFHAMQPKCCTAIAR
jgi:C-terminal processing protease CtpA/Prc